MESKDICSICTSAKVFVRCSGCGMPVCEQCSRFELIGSGCGCVWPVYYCSQCARNPMINPNAVFRDMDI